MEFRFRDVSLGATATVDQSWAHHLELVVNEEGITVDGGDEGVAEHIGGADQATNLPWDAVRRFAPGFALAFPDGSPATELQVTLADRELRLLVPADQLPPAQLRDLVSSAQSHMAQGSTDSRVAQPGSATHDKDANDSSASGVAVSGVAHDAPIMVTSSKRPTGRSRRPVALGSAAVVVVAAIVATVLVVSGGGSAARKDLASQTRTLGTGKGRSTRRRTTSSASTTSTTATTSPVPSTELSGPPSSVSPATAIAAVLIRPSDVRGWISNGAAGQDVAGDGQAVAASTTGNPILPSASSLVEPSYGILQQCSGLPADHLQLMTGNYYSGGPPTYNSNDFSNGAVNATQLQPTPQLFSVASEVASPQVQESDFSAFAARSFPSCLASFFTSYDRAEYGQLGANVDSVSVHAVAIPSVPGVETLEFILNAQLVSAGDVIGFRNTFFLLGAGRLEEAVVGTDSTDDPIPSTTWRALLATIEHRMEATAGRR